MFLISVTHFSRNSLRQNMESIGGCEVTPMIETAFLKGMKKPLFAYPFPSNFLMQFFVSIFISLYASFQKKPF